MTNTKQKFDTLDAVNYFKGTSLLIKCYLGDKKLSPTLNKKLEKELRKYLTECTYCGTWCTKANLTGGKCRECIEDEM